MWYKSSDYPGIDQENRSLTIAFANLLQKIDSQYQPTPDELLAQLTSDEPVLDWWALPYHVHDLDILEVKSDNPEWPDTSNAVVKFNWNYDNSDTTLDHYCLVHDAASQTIIDSEDGIIKPASTYGKLVGWATYTPIEPDPDFDVEEARILAQAGTEPNTYILQEGETLWDAARKHNVTAEELIKLNELDDPRTLSKGVKLHLPVREAKARNEVTYEILPEPVPMHISKAGGTQKYTFGNAKSWNDIEVTGRKHAENSNHLIHAIAHVELDKEGAKAAYYMDRIDIGNYTVTGRPQFLTGFNHSHLAEGHVLPTELTAPKQEVIEAINEAEEALSEIQKAANIKPRIMDIMLENAPPASPERPMAEDYRATLTPLKDDETPMTFMAEESLIIHEVARRRPAKPLHKGQSVQLSHTFEKDNTLYGLPAGTKDSPFWFGIPMDKVISEEELYNFNVPLQERLAMHGRLSVQERGVVLLSKTLSQSTRLKRWIKNKQGVQ